MMTPQAHQIAERLRAALRSHPRRPRSRDTRLAEQVPSRAQAAATPGEEFARRLREAIDA